MIPAERPSLNVKPRWTLLGLIRDWRPGPSEPISVSARCDVSSLPTPTILVPAMKPCGPASRIGLDLLSASSATSHRIGRFDLTCSERTPITHSIQGDVRIEPQHPGGDESMLDFERRLAAILQPPLHALLAPSGVLDWPAPLLSYQLDGVQALLERRELLLADDMGLGKTIQAIAALRILFYRQEVERALVIAPAGLLGQWTREFSLWAPDLTVVPVRGDPSARGTLWRLPAHVKLAGYETVREDVIGLDNSPVLREPWDVVVLDEASKIKNREARVSIACKRIPRHRRWALTGTPLENRVDDLHSILDFLLADPGRRSAHAVVAHDVRETLSAVQLRRRKADVLQDLPPKTVVEVPIALLPEQRRTYDLAEREGVVRLRENAAVTVTHVLELITHLKQICNCDPSSGQSAKLEDIAQRLEILCSEGHRALLFSQFTDERYGVGLLSARLSAFDPLTYTGAMSAAEKSRAVEAFLRDDRHKLFILSLRAGGFGLNLQTASYVFHFDRWWNPAVEDQAEGRAHRMGQTYPVTAIKYVCVDTIEERIEAKLREKRRLFQEIVDDTSMELTAALSESELFGLFGLEAPTRVKRVRHYQAGEQFEDWLAERLREQGLNVTLTPRSRDGGIDIVAERSDAIGVVTRLMIQCKNLSQPVGVAVVRELRGTIPERLAGTTPVVACPAGFTADAIAFAHDNGIVLWGKAELEALAGEDQNNTDSPEDTGASDGLDET